MGARHFSGGKGKTLKKSSVLTTSGGKTLKKSPQKCPFLHDFTHVLLRCLTMQAQKRVFGTHKMPENARAKLG